MKLKHKLLLLAIAGVIVALFGAYFVGNPHYPVAPWWAHGAFGTGLVFMCAGYVGFAVAWSEEI